MQFLYSVISTSSKVYRKACLNKLFSAHSTFEIVKAQKGDKRLQYVGVQEKVLSSKFPALFSKHETTHTCPVSLVRNICSETDFYP